MEQRIRERYSEAVLQAAMAGYSIAEGRIRLLDGFESFMYEFERAGVQFILRIGHSLRRSVDLIRGEVDWINALAAGGAAAAPAIPSRRGNLVEPIDDGRGGCFLATAFARAPGRPPNRQDWTPQFARRYGQAIGRMHAISARYEPLDAAWRRPQWDDPIMLDVAGWLPPTEAGILARFQALKRHLDRLPRDEDYGLIHQDAHAGNFFVDETGALTFFDFDDCAYGWYANDIAIVLFYALSGAEDGPAFAQWFLPHFLAGYRGERRLDPAWLAELPHFLKLREIDLYAVVHRSFDVDNLDDPWVAGYMAGRKERIEADLPYLDFDFAALARHL